MKTDEFAFFNQQLAAMLRDGIPLEGALQRLCREMRRGELRDDLQALEASARLLVKQGVTNETEFKRVFGL